MEKRMNNMPEIKAGQRQEIDVLADKICGQLGAVGGFSTAPVSACPHCGANRFIKHGKDHNGNQRYCCKKCGKTFSTRNNTFLKNSGHSACVWKRYVECMLEGLPLEECAKRCGITTHTAYTWRHKILHALDGQGLLNNYFRANRKEKPAVLAKLLIERASVA